MTNYHPITLPTQQYICPSNAVNGDNIGRVHFLWSFIRFWNHYFGTSFTDSSFTFSKWSGSNAFAVNSTTGELTVSNISNFTSDTTITIRVSVGGMYMDTVCTIIRVTDCVYFDPNYVGTSTGSRSQPYTKFRTAGLGTGTPGKTYLFKRGTTISNDWIRIVSPKVGGNYPAYINIGAYGQGARPIINGSNNQDGGSNRSFVTLGNAMNLDGSQPENSANNVRVFDFETTLDNPDTNAWYPFETKILGENFEFHRIKCSHVGLWEDGFFWFTGTTASPAVDRNIRLYNIETYENKFRAIKAESGIYLYNYRGRSTIAGAGFPVSFANKPYGEMKYLDVALADHEVSFGVQIRAHNQSYEFGYFEGINNPLVVYPLTNAYQVNFNNFFRNIILKDCKTRLSIFSKGAGVTINPDGIVFQNIKAINCEGSLEISQGATNSKVIYSDLGSNGIRLWSSAGNGLAVENTKAGTITIDTGKTGVNITNTQYGSITGPHSLLTSTTSTNEADLIGVGTELGHEFDLAGNEVASPPSIGAYELAKVVPDYVTITIQINGNGTAFDNTGEDPNTYEPGTWVALSATPNVGNSFVNWTVNGVVVATNPNFGYQLFEDTVIVANFEEIPIITYGLTVAEWPTGWGTAVDLTNEGPYPSGTEVELQATPETWTQFYRWSRDGQTLSTNQNYLYTTRGQNDLVLGEFQPKQYPLVVTVTPIGGGTVNITSGNYTEGQPVGLVATSNTGYTFLNWQKNGEILSTNPSYTHSKTAGNETISAHFTLAKHALIVTAGTGGTATGGGSFAQGETTPLVATIAEGYQFQGWYRDNVQLSTSNPYTYTARNQPDTVQARFLRKAVAVIHADPESGTKPLTVQFSSSGSVAETYHWDFGNGSTSFLALPYTVYQDSGTYTVTLTTTYGELTDTDTVQITVTDPVYVPPTIKITSPQNLSANFEAPAKLPFRVLANSELGISKVEYWVDGVLIATVTNAPYSYDWNNVLEGTYSIVAKAFDAEGSTESDLVSVTVYPPSEKYKLNGKELSDFGIIAGRAPNSNISVSGHLDFPKRMGKSFHVWDDEEGIEPYVSYNEIKFEGRDIKFHGYIEGTDKKDVMKKVYAFYELLDSFNGPVLFSCKWGSWLVIVKDQVETTPIKKGMVSIVVTFRQPDTGIEPSGLTGLSPIGIDGINFGDLGFTYMNLKNQWYRPTTKDHHAIGYFIEPFQATKPGAREMVLSGLFETETYQEMVSIISSLYSLFAKEGVRTLQINNEPFREFFVKDGFEVTNIIVKYQKVVALLKINMTELRKPEFDPDFWTDTDGNFILIDNQKIIIRT